MSWIQKLAETYDRCAGNEPDGVERLMPVCHTTQQAHIEIVLDAEGVFRRASVLGKGENTTLIPCTEESGGRAGSKPVNHPLCDKLQYIAGDFCDFGGEVTSGYSSNPYEPHNKYMHSLGEWANSQYGHPKLNAILKYVQAGHVVADLIENKVLHADATGKLLKLWAGDKDQAPAIFKAISTTQAQGDSFVRWCVEQAGNPISSTSQDSSLIAAWVAYYQITQEKRGYCMVTGKETTLAVQHPAKLRHAGDKAKLISSNDTSGYTFRGRFLDADEVQSVGFLVTQKAHNALRWLISRQAHRNGDQVFVSWAVSGKPVPDPFASTLDLFGVVMANEPVGVADIAQAFSLRLKKAIAGYSSKLNPAEDIVVMGLDSATPGRLAITFYRELKGSEFLERIEAWHAKCAWPQNFGKESKFIGAPAPRDIAEAAYGRRLDDKLRKSVVERLLPCIVDAQPIPRDLVDSATRRACNPVGLESWEWEKCLGIACALFRGYHTDRSYQMAIEPDRTTRDYLYGRLLAIADSIEGYALYLTDEGKKRETTAARLMQRFADRPFSTWRNIELALSPYKSRLQAGSEKSAAFLAKRRRLLDEVITTLDSIDGRTSDVPLTGEFLLGYHCQRQAFRPSGAGAASEDEVVEDSITQTTSSN